LVQALNSLPQPVAVLARQLLQGVDASWFLQALSAQAIAQAPEQVQVETAVKSILAGPSQSFAGLPIVGVIASAQVYAGSHAVESPPLPPLPPTPVAAPPAPPVPVAPSPLPPVPVAVAVAVVLVEPDVSTVQAPSAQAVIAARVTVKNRMFMFASPSRKALVTR
jgi:hypothetical protein